MIAFAYYRLPYLHHAIYVAQHEGEPEVLSSVAELNGKEGFVIAPFAPSSECPVVLMHPDESKLISAEGAENASRCGTSYVVTLQDLRRDVAESTSGRNFEAYTREFECFHRQLSEGKFSKIVLARKLRIQSNRQPLESVHTSAAQDAGKTSDVQNTANASVVQDADSLKALFLKTCRMYPRLFVALVYTPQSGLWLMATPEILLKGEQNQMATMSLAGTQKAEPSKTIADYPVEGIEWSEKNREEQQYVTDYIEDSIKAFSDEYQKKGPYTRWLPISIISVPTSLSVCMIRGVWAMCSMPYILRLPSAEYRRMKLAGLSCSMNISRANTTVVLWDRFRRKVRRISMFPCAA